MLRGVQCVLRGSAMYVEGGVGCTFWKSNRRGDVFRGNLGCVCGGQCRTCVGEECGVCIEGEWLMCGMGECVAMSCVEEECGVCGGTV